MDLDLQSLFGLHVRSFTHFLSPILPHLGLCTDGAISQPRKTTSVCDPPPPPGLPLIFARKGSVMLRSRCLSGPCRRSRRIDCSQNWWTNTRHPPTHTNICLPFFLRIRDRFDTGPTVRIHLIVVPLHYGSGSCSFFHVF
jgi:hypothetical protein